MDQNIKEMKEGDEGVGWGGLEASTKHMGTGKCSPRASRVTMLACRFVVISIAVASAKQLGWAGNFAEEGGACW